MTMDQDAVNGKERVWDGFRCSEVRCGVVAGLWSAGGLLDDAKSYQLLLQGPLGGLRIGVVSGQG